MFEGLYSKKNIFFSFVVFVVTVASVVLVGLYGFYGWVFGIISAILLGVFLYSRNEWMALLFLMAHTTAIILCGLQIAARNFG